MPFDPDIAFVIGLILAVLSVPPMVGAFVEGRAPRAVSVVVLVAGGLIVSSLALKPGGYTIDETPDVFVTVIARLLN